MAKKLLKPTSKKEVEEVVQQPRLEIVQYGDKVESKYLNEAEQEALAEQHQKYEEQSKKVSTEKMDKVIAVVQEQFNLPQGKFNVTGIADKGSKSQISLNSDDFEVTIVIKDNEKYQIL